MLNIKLSNKLNEINQGTLEKWSKKHKKKNLKYVDEIKKYFDPFFDGKDRIILPEILKDNPIKPVFEYGKFGEINIEDSNIVVPLPTKLINGDYHNPTKKINLLAYLKELKELISVAIAKDYDLVYDTKFIEEIEQNPKKYKNLIVVLNGSTRSKNIFQVDDLGWILGRSGNEKGLKKVEQLIKAIEVGGYSRNYSIILSRKNIDIWRMSDHKKSGIESCHSVGGAYEQCATFEGNGYGFLAYLVDNKNLKDIDLQKGEIFADEDRSVKGIIPLARIRMRVLLEQTTGIFLTSPESRTYGSLPSQTCESFYGLVLKYARDKQKQAINKINKIIDESGTKEAKFVFVGGSYSDSDRSEFLRKLNIEQPFDHVITRYSEQEAASIADRLKNDFYPNYKILNDSDIRVEYPGWRGFGQFVYEDEEGELHTAYAIKKINDLDVTQEVVLEYLPKINNFLSSKNLTMKSLETLNGWSEKDGTTFIPVFIQNSTLDFGDLNTKTQDEVNEIIQSSFAYTIDEILELETAIFDEVKHLTEESKDILKPLEDNKFSYKEAYGYLYVSFRAVRIPKTYEAYAKMDKLREHLKEMRHSPLIQNFFDKYKLNDSEDWKVKNIEFVIREANSGWAYFNAEINFDKLEKEIDQAQFVKDLVEVLNQIRDIYKEMQPKRNLVENKKLYVRIIK